MLPLTVVEQPERGNQKNASATVSGIVGKSLTFGRQGDRQHVTEVVRCEVFVKEFDRNFAAWSSGGLTLGNLAEKVTLASTVAFCEVGRGTQL